MPRRHRPRDAGGVTAEGRHGSRGSYGSRGLKAAQRRTGWGGYFTASRGQRMNVERAVRT